MAARPTARSHGATKHLKECPECGGALADIERPAVRLVSSLTWLYPVPYAGKKCPKCGWQVG
jgi:hypothetical protein